MNLKLIMKRILQTSSLVMFLSCILIQCNVIWRSPKSYKPKQLKELQPSIMSLDDYSNSGLIDTHARPYIYKIESKNGKGAVLVFGAEHTKDPKDKQFPIMEREWTKFSPTVTLVEGRLGFLFSWIQEPIKTLGEGGFAAKLAKSNGVKLYSWEPDRDSEINYLLKKYNPVYIAALYCLRPYRSNYSGLSGRKANKIMEKLIEERTNRKGIKGVITSVEQIDSLWRKDHPDLDDWRTYKHPRNGWPEGNLKKIAEESNLLRDVFMCNSIIELVNNGERVFIIMGSSHAPRIERTLKENLK
jgi:hypothetical protein